MKLKEDYQNVEVNNIWSEDTVDFLGRDHDVIKSVKLPNLSTSASMQETINWFTNLSVSDALSYETASVEHITKNTFQGWLTNIEYGNESVSGSTLLANSEILLISSSTDNTIKFETAYDVTLSDFVITTSNLVLPVTKKENVWYSGSIVILDIEPADVFVAGTPNNEITKNNVGNILLHNKCAWSGFCCVDEHTIISTNDTNKPIKEVNVGDLVWSYNFETNTKELKEVIGIVSPIHDSIVDIQFNNGSVVKSTFDHIYYNAEGKMLSYEPEKTKQWYNGEVEKIKIGDKCLNENGNEIEVVSIVEEHSSTQTYTLFVKDNQNFYANGVLVYDEEK